MKKLLLAATLLAASTTATADVRYYAEWKNTLKFGDLEYIPHKDVNDLRFGAKGKHAYFEAGYVNDDGKGDGYGFETGYKFKYESFEFKGKFEGRKYGNVFENKLETEYRYYFN